MKRVFKKVPTVILRFVRLKASYTAICGIPVTCLTRPYKGKNVASQLKGGVESIGKAGSPVAGKLSRGFR